VVLGRVRHPETVRRVQVHLEASVIFHSPQFRVNFRPKPSH
jgi:hypothetical protein